MEPSESKLNQLMQVGFLVVKVIIVILAITGTVQLFKAVFKTVAFDQYPIDQYRLMTTSPDGKQTEVSVKQQFVERKLQMLEDYSAAISMLLISGGLYWLMRKKIKES